MKMTKRIAAMAACAVMAASSMVGMGASAADTQTLPLSNSTIATYADGVFNGIQKGAYYNGTSSFVNITGTSASNAECTFYNVSYDNKNIYGVTSTFSAGTAGNGFSATFNSGQWYYYDKNNKRVSGTDTLYVGGTYKGGKITISGKVYSR